MWKVVFHIGRCLAIPFTQRRKRCVTLHQRMPAWPISYNRINAYLCQNFYIDILVFSGVVLRGRTFRMPLGHESGIILDKLVTERLAFSISVVHSVKDAVRRYLSACIKWPVIQYQTFGHLVLRFLSL